MNKTAQFTYSDYASVVRYDPEAGKFFRLKDSNRGRILRSGDEVTQTINSRGYLVLTFFKRAVLAHRVGWLLMTGAWPENQIDHINRIKTDNRWVNLRAATIGENNANAIKTKHRDLPTGVTQHKRDRLFYAMISVNNKSMHLGCFRDQNDAHAAYLSAKKRFHGQFSPYETPPIPPEGGL